MTKPWWAQPSGLQIAIATAVILAGFAAAWSFYESLARLHTVFTDVFHFVASLWVTRRVARSLGAALEEAGPEPSGFAVAAAVGEAIILPVYCAVAVLLAAAAMTFLSRAPDTTFIDAWFATIAVGVAGIVAALMSAVTTLAIWHRISRAGWIAASVAQGAGALTFASLAFFDNHAMRPDPDVDKWYNVPTDPAYLWLIFLAMCCLFSAFAIIRLWQQIKGERLVPWMTGIALVVMVGYLAGFDRLTGFWLTSWLYGAFFILRFTTYGLFLFRSTEASVWRSGWFVCFVATLIMCVVTSTHLIATGNFGMTMQPMIMQPFPPIGMEGKFFTFSLTMTLCTTRDLLFLVWLNRVQPGGWADAIGFGALFALYWPLAFLIDVAGWTFLFPVFYPLSAVGVMDLLWPVAMIAVLVVLIVRARRRDLVETPSWA